MIFLTSLFIKEFLQGDEPMELQSQKGPLSLLWIAVRLLVRKYRKMQFPSYLFNGKGITLDCSLAI